jgi:DNA-binding response OmpR family regulator
MAKILIVEDEPEIAAALAYDLKLEGYEVEAVPDGEAASVRGREPGWDLILLDVTLPKKDGFDVCRDLRKAGVRTPIVILTARAHEAEKVLGLDLGGDDYITKPFSARELRARIRARLRSEPAKAQDIVRCADLEIDTARVEVRKAGKKSEVTPQEFKLLLTFAQNRGRVLSRERLIDLAWGRDISVTDRAVDTHVVTLRRKLGPELIASVRGMGYRFDG